MQGTVTAVEPQQRRGGRRFNVYLDGRFAFSVAAEVAVTLKKGDYVGGNTLASVLEADQVRVALDAALVYLGHRPRSEREIRQRLGRKQIPPSVMERVLQKLREHGLVDDTSFAQFWVEQRQTFRPRGARLVRAELRQRGVAAEVADTAVGEMEGTADEDAYRAAQKKAAQLATSGVDERTFRQRLGQFLARRGFGWDTVQPAVNRLWSEQADGVS